MYQESTESIAESIITSNTYESDLESEISELNINALSEDNNVTVPRRFESIPEQPAEEEAHKSLRAKSPRERIRQAIAVSDSDLDLTQYQRAQSSNNENRSANRTDNEVNVFPNSSKFEPTPPSGDGKPKQHRRRGQSDVGQKNKVFL
jgi:hypothetical protein